MKEALRTGVGRGAEIEEVEKEGKESWKFYTIDILGLKRVLEKGFGALRGAESMKMRCRSVWNTARGLKISKMAEKIDFSRKKMFFGEKKSAAFSNKSEQTVRLQIAICIRWGCCR